MSDVRLSNNASPTLELRAAEARQPGGDSTTRAPTRRNLFGPAAASSQDREAFHREVEAKLREGERAFAERWDFDVVNDRPLLSPPGPGNFKWEAVVSSPGFYSRPPPPCRRRPKGPPRENIDRCGDDNNRDGGGGGGDDDVERTAVQSDTDSPPSTGLRKRPVDRSSGRSSDECQSKRLQTDDEKDQSDTKVERTPC